MMLAPYDTALLVAVLFGAGAWLCMSRRSLRILMGVLLLSNGANLVLLAMSGDPSGRATPTQGMASAGAPAADPLPQALILTAIVIGFAVAAYVTVLLYRIHTDHGTSTVPPEDGEAGPAGKGGRHG